MTIEEFKAFLDGMDVQGEPSADQWARIKEKIETLAAIPASLSALGVYRSHNFTPSEEPFAYRGVPSLGLETTGAPLKIISETTQ